MASRAPNKLANAIGKDPKPIIEALLLEQQSTQGVQAELHARYGMMVSVNTIRHHINHPVQTVRYDEEMRKWVKAS